VAYFFGAILYSETGLEMKIKRGDRTGGTYYVPNALVIFATNL